VRRDVGDLHGREASEGSNPEVDVFFVVLDQRFPAGVEQVLVRDVADVEVVTLRAAVSVSYFLDERGPFLARGGPPECR
jgi:hypothetical protein